MESALKAKFTDLKRKIARAVFGTLSFSAVLFIFQACYGTPTDMMVDNCVEGMVTSKTNGLPIPGIKVSWLNQPFSDVTDPSGKFKFYLPWNEEYVLRFEDIDAAQNGTFLSKDTIVKVPDKKIILQISLDAQ